MIDDKLFCDLEKALGSKYAAVNYIAKLAREVSDRFDNDIPDSVAIRWAIEGVDKEYVESKKRIELSRKSNESKIVEDTLSTVTDEEVIDAVKLSIHESLRVNNLVYMYNDISQLGRQSRVRILTNTAWDAIMAERLDR